MICLAHGRCVVEGETPEKIQEKFMGWRKKKRKSKRAAAADAQRNQNG